MRQVQQDKIDRSFFQVSSRAMAKSLTTSMRAQDNIDKQDEIAVEEADRKVIAENPGIVEVVDTVH